MTTIRKNLQTDHSDSDLEFEDANDYEYSKYPISRFFYYADDSEITFDSIWDIQQYSGNIIYLDERNLANKLLSINPTQKIIILQYDIPKEDEETLKKFNEVCEKRIGKDINKDGDGDTNAFFSINDSFANLEYFSGYWEYTRSDKNSSKVICNFIPCDPIGKEAYLNAKNELVQQAEALSSQLLKIENKISNNKSLMGLAALSTLISIIEPSFLLAAAIIITHQYDDYKCNRKNEIQILEKTDKICEQGSFLAFSLFAHSKKFNTETGSEKRKTYGL